MKIAFTGSSSTGKTTLAKELLKKGCIKNFLYVKSRSLIEKYNTENIDDFSRSNYLAFQREWIEIKRSTEIKYEDYVTDRSYIDAIAYMISKNMVDQKLIDISLKEIKNYDYIFYLPYGKIKFESDGYRSENYAFNKSVDDAIINLLEEHQVKYYRVNQISLNDRLKYIEKVINCV